MASPTILASPDCKLKTSIVILPGPADTSSSSIGGLPSSKRKRKSNPWMGKSAKFQFTRIWGTLSPSSGGSISVNTPGTELRACPIIARSLIHVFIAADISRENHASSAAITPITSSLPIFIGRPKARCGGEFAQAASIRSLRPSSNPLVCGPRRTLPPL